MPLYGIALSVFSQRRRIVDSYSEIIQHQQEIIGEIIFSFITLGSFRMYM